MKVPPTGTAVTMDSSPENKQTMKPVSSLRKKSSGSSNRSRVNFSEEEKKVEEHSSNSSSPTKRRLPRRKSGTKENQEIKNDAGAKDAKNVKESPKGFSLAGIGRRISSRFTDSRTKPVPKIEECEDEDEPVPEEDPVMTIFESRNTHRVRFTVEGGEGSVEPLDEEEATQEVKQSGKSIKQFMSRALFGSKSSSKKLEDEMKLEVASLGGSLVWESAETPTGPEVIHTAKNSGASSRIRLSFTEDPKARAKVSRLLEKARQAEHMHFRYEYAVKCCLKALTVLKQAKYPDDHPTVAKAVSSLNSAHHVLSSYKNSANIVKMGIKYEDAGELIRALKMYTIAYRIRRDNLSRNHPSLVVLLNMLGSIQIKRGELQEAMQIYELALKDSPVIFSANEEDTEEAQPQTRNLLAKSVTYREMGTIYERWGKTTEALNIYHKSLECVSEWKDAINSDENSRLDDGNKSNRSLDYSLGNVQLTPSVPDTSTNELGEMEIFLASENKPAFGVSKSRRNEYESYFPSHLGKKLAQSSSLTDSRVPDPSARRDAHADMDVALTLHQIAQLHRSKGEFSKALDAFEVSLRGMKYAVGKHHPNVAAVLGNIGNLQKEMGDLDAAYHTYQEVLGIESYRLGLSHPDVTITLHNIATIDAARGNYEHALQLYRKVLGLQKRLFGEDHVSVSVTAACMGDVYEKVGEFTNAMESYEEAVRITTCCVGRHSLDAARLLHKLGKLAFQREDFHMAESFISRTVLIYRLNKVADDHEWMVDANRDAADIDAAIAMGRGRKFEC